MKVIVPVVNDNKEKFSIADGFHNAEHACIYDYSTNKYEWVITQKISSLVGELGMELKMLGVEKVISKNMPLMALGLFVDCGIKVYQATEDDLVENIELLTNDKLPFYSLEMARQNTSCSGACGTCETDCK